MELIIDSLVVRKEFINFILDKMEECRAEALTNGEIGILCEMLEAIKECTCKEEDENESFFN